ncbi:MULTISPECIES: glycine zipper 2TM domain-containing protein [Ramlibacter]|nr:MULTISPECIES: glycine zipper 2TM domain-containing protein [Ramlibacter]
MTRRHHHPAAWALAAAFALPLAAHAQGPGPIAPQAPCPHCGVVESVVPVERHAPTKGIAGTGITPGMAIGGVVGGVLGNQLGGGSGKAATTVLGAAGGAYAGHYVEKNKGRYTAYLMRIRMQDGSLRTVEQTRALPRGARVVVEGNRARLA